MKKTIIWISSGILIMAILAYGGYRRWMSPTRILVVNTLKAQEADFILNNDSRHIQVECVEADKMGRLNGYDAVILYARRLYLNDEQMNEIERISKKGTPVFTKTLKSSNIVINKNLSKEQTDTLQRYFDNENRQNFRNGLRYLRHIATPHRWGDQNYEPPMDILKKMYYHREYGRYFKNPSARAQCLSYGMHRQQTGKNAKTTDARRRDLPAHGKDWQRHAHLLDAREKHHNVYALSPFCHPRRMDGRQSAHGKRFEEFAHRDS